MIAIKVQSNLGNAKQYFEEHLNSGDYYESGGATPGQWYGKGADALGLSGRVKEEDFLALCENKNPATGETLTARMNTTRNGGTEANRRVFFDFTFCPQKSVSIQALAIGDDRIREAHENAVRTALAELETFACARVRSKQDLDFGKDRKTGNLPVATFTHETSRSVAEGVPPDPLLHTHACVFNATNDQGQWKALETLGMMRAQSYASAAYDHALCQSLQKMGYQTRTTENGFELAHISDETCQRFSKRRKAIVKETAELEANGAKRSHHELKDAVAHDQRIRKQGPQTAEGLRADWQGQMTEQELAACQQALHQKPITLQPISANESFQWAKDHTYERLCVTTETNLMAEALRRGRGQDWSIQDLKKACSEDSSLLREVGGSGRVTTADALQREKYILGCVESGKQQYQPLANVLLESASSLSPIQRQAAEKITASQDWCTLFRGVAGAGKSYTLEHVGNALKANGHELVILAPQTKQVLSLKKDFQNDSCSTLASFLAGKSELSSKSVILLDEAGQVGGDDLANLFAKAKLAGARVVLSGDTRQHTSVGACDSLRAIEKFANPHSAEIVGEEAIMRQKVAWYKAAVALASELDTGASFDLLDKHGAVLETNERVADTAKLYIEKSQNGESVLVLSQTNAEVSALNEAIREALKESGKLDPKSAIQFERLRALDCTTAEKQLAKSYEGATILTNRKLGNLKAGTEVQFVKQGDNGSIVILSDGKELLVKKENLDRLTICKREEIELCKGDKIQLRANCKIGKNHKLANGAIMEFVGRTKEGLLQLQDSNGKVHTLPPDFRQLTHGYALTSYASQGQTVDHVLISDSSSRGATSAREFYVSISRGRQSVTLLTADKESLRDHIHALGERDLASDLNLEKKQLPSTLETIAQARGVPPVSAVSLAERQGRGVLGGIVESFKSSVGKIFHRGSQGFLQMVKQIGMASKSVEDSLDQSAELTRGG